MKTIKYITYLLVGLFLSTHILVAQEYEHDKDGNVKTKLKHEFSIYGAGGLSTLKYKTTIGDNKYGVGGSIGGDYKFFLWDMIGIGAGVEFSLYNAKTNLGNYSHNFMTVDRDEKDFEFRTTIRDYKETQKAYMFNIPIMLQFQTPVSEKAHFYAAVGGKFGFTMKGKYNTKANFINSGYYEVDDLLITQHGEYGFGDYRRSMKDDLKFKTAYIGSIEAGLKWKLTDNNSLYTGAYFDYGVNNIRKDAINKDFVEYDGTDYSKPSEYKANSVLVSRDRRDGNNIAMSKGKIRPMAVGIKLKFAFGKRSKVKAKKQEEITEVIPVVEPKEKQEEEQEPKEEKNQVVEKEVQEEIKKQEEVVEKAKKIILDPISFYDLNQVKLSATQKKELDTKISVLKEHANLNVIAEGHTCTIGDKKVNLRISKQRAEAVKAYMVSQGVESKRITVVAEGKTSPLVEDDNIEEYRKKNRRVELIVTE